MLQRNYGYSLEELWNCDMKITEMWEGAKKEEEELVVMTAKLVHTERTCDLRSAMALLRSHRRAWGYTLSRL